MVKLEMLQNNQREVCLQGDFKMNEIMVDIRIAYTIIGVLSLVPLYLLGEIIILLYKIMFDK